MREWYSSALMGPRRRLQPSRGMADMSEISQEQERWLPIVGYEDHYEVSDRGRVRSVARTLTYGGRWGPMSRFFPSRVLTPIAIWDGHLQVCMIAPGIKKATKKLHLLVLTAFVSPRPAGMFGCHNDDDPTNNNLSNLRWDTPSSNCLDAVRHGRHHLRNRTTCPRDHQLVAPNLVLKAFIKSGHRSCLACSRTHPRVNSGRVAPEDFKAASDFIYHEIMASRGAVPSYIRLPSSFS